MIYYIAGPISLGGTCSDAEVARFTASFTEAAALLRGDGHVVLCPTEMGERDSWLSYMRETIPMVCEADCVYALPRWQDSRGARIEVGLARDLGIPVLEQP